MDIDGERADDREEGEGVRARRGSVLWFFGDETLAPLHSLQEDLPAGACRS